VIAEEPAHAWCATPRRRARRLPGVAADLADWSGLSGIDVTFVREALPDEAAVVDRLTRFPILVAMRERTAFPRSTLQRLPNLRLLVTTGMRNASIDLGAAVTWV
jgi:phosphoglycerate dehydrogenase-like enzyme